MHRGEELDTHVLIVRLRVGASHPAPIRSACAAVAELVYAMASKAIVLRDVWVRVPPAAFPPVVRMAYPLPQEKGP